MRFRPLLSRAALVARAASGPERAGRRCARRDRRRARAPGQRCAARRARRRPASSARSPGRRRRRAPRRIRWCRTMRCASASDGIVPSAAARAAAAARSAPTAGRSAASARRTCRCRQRWRRSSPQRLDALRAEAARTAAPDRARSTRPGAGPAVACSDGARDCGAAHALRAGLRRRRRLRRDRLCLRHDLRQWQPLRPPAPRGPLGGGRVADIWIS